MAKDIFNFDKGRKTIVIDNLLKSYGIDQDQQTIEKSDESTTGDSLEKGGKRAVIGEKREFSGRMYIKTAQGWKFFGKGTGSKAQDHHNSAASHDSKQTSRIDSAKSLLDEAKGTVNKKKAMADLIKEQNAEAERKAYSKVAAIKKQSGLKLDGTDNTDDVLAAHSRGEISSDHVRVHYSHQKINQDKKMSEKSSKSKAEIGEIRSRGGVNYIKTENGWKYHGKGEKKEEKQSLSNKKTPGYVPDSIKHRQMKERQKGADVDAKNAEKQKIKEKQAKTLASNKENLTRFLKEESWVRKRLEDNGFSDKNILQQRLKQNFATFKDQANVILKKYGKDFDIDFNIDTDFRYNSFSIDVGFNFNQLHDKFEEYLTEQKQKFPHADKKTLLNPKLWGMLGEVLHVGENKYGGHSSFGSNLAFGLSSWSDDYNNSVRVK